MSLWAALASALRKLLGARKSDAADKAARERAEAAAERARMAAAEQAREAERLRGIDGGER